VVVVEDDDPPVGVVFLRGVCAVVEYCTGHGQVAALTLLLYHKHPDHQLALQIIGGHPLDLSPAVNDPYY
jgi:hypothetical protein